MYTKNNFKKYIINSFIFLLLFIYTSINAYAFEQYESYIINETADILNENKEDILFTLKKEDKVMVVDENEEYLLIKYIENNEEKEGWIKKELVKEKETKEESDTEENNEDKILMNIDEEDEKTDSEKEEIKELEKKTNSEDKTATIKGTNVNIRKAPVDGAVLCRLSTGHVLNIIGQTTANDHIWYNVKFTYNDKEITGYVIDTYVNINITVTDADEEFELYLSNQGFPESYKPYLRILHKKYPLWKFNAIKTDLSWNTVVNNESRVGKNLVPLTSSDSWKSTDSTAYNWETNTWYGFDGPSWVAASRDIVQFYLDPRNFLDESSIFQFETLEYKDYQSDEKNVGNILKNTFMSGSYTEPDGSRVDYAKTFIKTGKKIGISPYFIAARCYQEQGKGTSKSIAGNVPGYENLFNYYHIGAYPANGNSSVINGLIYASKNDESTFRPWNTRYKSILGGANFIYKKYINKGQNTLYLQKFNVVNKDSGLYGNQYMTNLQAAASEASHIEKAYINKNTEIVFNIPVYLNMPASACVQPDSEANPNNYIKSLSIKGQSLTPTFDPEILKYSIIVNHDITKLEINATAVAVTSSISGIGSVDLKDGDNVFEIKCTAQNGDVRTYVLNVTKKIEQKPDEDIEIDNENTENNNTNNEENKTPEQTEKPEEEKKEELVITSPKYEIGTYITGIKAGTSIDDIKNNLSINYGNIKIVDKAGKEKKNVSNGDYLKIYDKDEEIMSLRIIISGDSNCDGKINNGDLIQLKKVILNVITPEEVQEKSLDINGDSKVNNGDLILIKKHILGIKEI